MKNYEALKQQGDVIWNIANLLRGPYRPPQYRRVMIPLTVLRRLDCVLESSKDQVIEYNRKLKADDKYDADTIETMINHRFKLNFHNTSEFSFQNLLGDADKLAANLNNYIAGFSARARKIIGSAGTIRALPQCASNASFDSRWLKGWQRYSSLRRIRN